MGNGQRPVGRASMLQQADVSDGLASGRLHMGDRQTDNRLHGGMIVQPTDSLSSPIHQLLRNLGMAKQCRCSMRPTAKTKGRTGTENLRERIGYERRHRRMSGQTSARRQEGGKGSSSAERSDLVGRMAEETDQRTKRTGTVEMARRVATPRTAIDHGTPPDETDYRIVVIEQRSMGQMTQPESNMRTFARATGRKKGMRFSLADHHRCMDQQGLMRGGIKRKEEHERMVETKLKMTRRDRRRKIELGLSTIGTEMEDGSKR